MPLPKAMTTTTEVLTQFENLHQVTFPNPNAFLLKEKLYRDIISSWEDQEDLELIRMTLQSHLTLVTELQAVVGNPYLNQL